MTNKTIKLIIDTDPGHDDAMAILMLLASKNIEILAITTVAGNSSIKNTTINAQYILNLANQTSIPVYSGAAKPLKRKLIQADVHGASGLDGSENNKVKYKNNCASTTSEIIKLIEKYPQEITILTLGPLTNIAKVLKQNPKLALKTNKIVVMGGAINVPGNKSRTAEFNFFVDPEAAKIVMEAKVAKILVPLDACNNILMNENDIEKFSSGKIGQALSKMLKPYIENIAKFEGVNGAMMYDPLAAYFLVNPAAFITKMMDIVIETKGEFTSGMSVAEQRIVADNRPNVNVVTKINAKAFITDFIKSIKSLDER